MLTSEELLRRRVKIADDYPDSPYTVGDVFSLTKDDMGRSQWVNQKGEYTYRMNIFDKYPEIFQPLPWYACRKVNDMPRYVKWAQSNPVQVAEVVQWDMEGAMFPTCLIKGECHMRCVVECDLLPATFDEYITYIKR